MAIKSISRTAYTLKKIFTNNREMFRTCMYTSFFVNFSFYTCVRSFS